MLNQNEFPMLITLDVNIDTHLMNIIYIRKRKHIVSLIQLFFDNFPFIFSLELSQIFYVTVTQGPYNICYCIQVETLVYYFLDDPFSQLCFVDCHKFFFLSFSQLVPFYAHSFSGTTPLLCVCYNISLQFSDIILKWTLHFLCFLLSH